MFEATVQGASQGRLSRAQLLQLAARADALDLHDLALELARQALARGGGDDWTEADLARPLVLASRFIEALELLERGDSDDWRVETLPPRDVPCPVDRLAWAAAKAALGDGTALSWLVDAVAENRGPGDGILAARLLQAAARARRDVDLVDSTALYLFRRRALTGPSAAAVAALAVADRNAHSPTAMAAVVGESVALLRGAAPQLERNPQPALDAAGELVRRGDKAGARLLLMLADRLSPGIARIQARRRELDRGPGAFYHPLTMVGLVVAAVLALLAASGPARAVIVATIVGARFAWNRLATMPGLSRSETRVWRALHHRVVDRRTGQLVEQRTDISMPLLYVGVGLIAFCFGVWAAVSVTEAWNGAHDLPPGTVGSVGAVAWIAGMVGIPAACLMGLVRLRREWVLRAQRRDEAARAADAAALSRRCDCFASELMDGPQATAYASHHLLADPEPIDPVAAGAGLRLLSCPASRMRWLEVMVAREGASVLLRASADAVEAARPAASPDTRPGMYL